MNVAVGMKIRIPKFVICVVVVFEKAFLCYVFRVNENFVHYYFSVADN